MLLWSFMMVYISHGRWEPMAPPFELSNGLRIGQLMNIKGLKVLNLV